MSLFHVTHTLLYTSHIVDITDLRGAITLGGCDILDLQTHQIILQYLHGRKADVVMRCVCVCVCVNEVRFWICFLMFSDMAPNSSGQHTLDHHRIMVAEEYNTALRL